MKSLDQKVYGGLWNAGTVTKRFDCRTGQIDFNFNFVSNDSAVYYKNDFIYFSFYSSGALMSSGGVRVSHIQYMGSPNNSFFKLYDQSK